MKRLLIGFIVLLAAVWLGVTMHNNPGYVLVAYDSWSVETSLWFAIIIMCVVFAVLAILFRLGGSISFTIGKVRRWFSNRRQRKARARTAIGLYELVSGNWKVAEKNLIHAAKDSDMSLVNYLAAALMAQKQNAYERSENYLRQAQKISTKYSFAVGLTQARLQMVTKKWEEAFATLQFLRQNAPKNILVLELLQKVCVELHDWGTLRDLLPAIRKYHILSTTDANQLEQQVWFELLKQSAKDERIEMLWSQLPHYLQKNQSLLGIYCNYLVAHNKYDAAETLLKLSLRKVLNHDLLNLYSALQSSNPLKKLARAESWLKAQPQNASLLLCLGRICKELKLWGKSRLYLEKSAKLAPHAETYWELGQIMEAQHDTNAAMEFYSKGLRLKEGVNPKSSAGIQS